MNGYIRIPPPGPSAPGRFAGIVVPAVTDADLVRAVVGTVPGTDATDYIRRGHTLGGVTLRKQDIPVSHGAFTAVLAEHRRVAHIQMTRHVKRRRARSSARMHPRHVSTHDDPISPGPTERRARVTGHHTGAAPRRTCRGRSLSIAPSRFA